ncbi:C1 family peptidase [Ferruginibacter yonginensis]|uniref:C1 family peptidase n=1 Tax=Ferruginibacter yonginensis TaxID=1310416 RepID=A0ABV8QUK9_9BACT
MALHMVDDPDGQDDYVDDNSGGGSNTGGGGMSGGGGLLSFLPLLIGLFSRGGGNNSSGRGGCGGKGILIVLVLAVAGYFLLNQNSCSNIVNSDVTNSLFSQSGYNFNPNETKKAQVYEGLEDDNAKNPLPERVSLAAFAPTVQNQGKQGSCVAWSSAYAARTILEAVSTNQDPNSIAYSPAFLYNNIALEDCQGSYIQRAMEFMQQRGAVSYNDFPYDENNCSRQANNTLFQVADQNKIHGFHRLTETDDVNGINIRAIKEHLAKDAPVVIGMMVGGTFMQEMMGAKVWHPTNDDAQMIGFGGHAMCVVGYDDRIEGGAFQIMNSWGPEWGQNGFAYVRYGDFKNFVREAYGLDPLPKRGAALNATFECNIGLFNTGTKQNITMQYSGSNVFKTASPIKKGDKFKIEIKNEVACYIYIFTPNTAGQTEVLFPYKPIHSAYCGITGYRLFPRKESIQADEIGNKDVMGIVVSKTELDYKALNTAINNSAGADFNRKFNNAVAAAVTKDVDYSKGSNGAIHFSAGTSEKALVACLVEIEKQ